MPYQSNDALPEQVKGLPSEQQTKWRKVFNSAYEGTCKDRSDRDKCASKIAWSQIDSKYKGKSLQEFSLAIRSATHNKQEGTYRWKAVASDIDADFYNDNMSLELFNDFIRRIEINEIAPEEFRTSYWQGGMPYVSVSHYPDLEGKAVPGPIDAVYLDGTFLKSNGQFNHTPLGLACYDAICKDLYQEPKTENPVRVSIAFLDFAHTHKSNGYQFERENLDDICPECLLERIRGEYHGKIFQKGLLVHMALTRVPANERTSMEVDKSMTTRKEDAASIVGDELAGEIEAEAKMVGKSLVEDVMVVKSEEAEKGADPVYVEERAEKKCPDCGKPMKDCECDKEDEKKEEKSLVDSRLDRIEKMLSDFANQPAATLVSVPEHELDTVFSQFKAAYDEVKATNLPTDEKLRMLQDGLNDIGTSIVENMKSHAVTPEAETVQDTTDLVQALSTAMQSVMRPVADKLDLVSQQLQQLSATQNVVKSTSAIPVRRSIAPTLSMQQELLAQQFATVNKPTSKVKQSETPKLRAVLEDKLQRSLGQQ